MRTLVIALFLSGAALAQTKSPATKVAATQAVIAAAPKPDAQSFKTYEEYVEALAAWVIEQKVSTAGKDVVLNVAAAPAPGRYQILYSPNARADTFMLDTSTGRVWQFVTYIDLDGDPHAWRLLSRIDGLQDLADFYAAHTAKAVKP